MHHIKSYIDWLGQVNPYLFTGITVLSIVLFVLSIIAVPFFIVALPKDWYRNPAHEHEAVLFKTRSKHLRFCLAIFKNIIGLVMVAIGIAMLVLPGQGILTIIIGLIFLEFPGKRALERKIVANPAILTRINQIRKLAGKEPLQL